MNPFRWTLATIGVTAAASFSYLDRPPHRTLAITGATIYVSPDAPPIAHGTVVIRDGKITAVSAGLAVPADARIVPCDRCVVTAGFWNSHIHLTEAKWNSPQTTAAATLSAQLADMLTSRGFTSAVDLGSDLNVTIPLRRRIASGEVTGPTIYTAGSGIFPPNGIPYYLGNIPAAVRQQIPQPATPDAAVTAVLANISAGADVAKLFTGSLIARGTVLPMPEAVARAAVQTAHAHHQLVFAHPSNLAGTLVAMNSGVDILAHAPSAPQGVDSALIRTIIAHHMAMIPTLKMFATTVTTDTAWLNPIYAVVRQYHAMGGEFLFGTDVGYMTDYSTEGEFTALATSGLDWHDMLRMLTTAPVARFGLSASQGTVEVGKDGDLVVLDADPAKSVTAFSAVRVTIRDGRIIYQRP